MSWNIFKRLFKNKYISEQYYDEKAKEFNDPQLGMLTMEEFVTMVVYLQCYVPYLRDGKVKVDNFIICLPSSYKEKNEFEMPKTMDDAIKKAKLCYHLFKTKIRIN